MKSLIVPRSRSPWQAVLWAIHWVRSIFRVVASDSMEIESPPAPCYDAE